MTPVDKQRRRKVRSPVATFVSLLVAAVAGAAAGLLVHLIAPTEYQSRSVLYFEPGASDSAVLDVPDAERFINNQRRLIASGEILQDAARRTPGYSATALEQGLATSTERLTDIIDLTFTADTPSDARRNLTAIQRSYLDSTLTTSFQVEVISGPTSAPDASGPTRVQSLLAGGLIGLAVGLGFTAVVRARTPHRPQSDQS